MHILFFTACNCNKEGGAIDETCDDDTGVCQCQANVIGDKCDYCTPGSTNFPACTGNLLGKLRYLDYFRNL